MSIYKFYDFKNEKNKKKHVFKTYYILFSKLGNVLNING